MKSSASLRHPCMRGGVLFALSFSVALFAAACSTTTSSFTMSGPAPDPAERAPSPDPRVGLSAGWLDAGEAAWNVRLVSTTPPPEEFVGVTNSDLAFYRDYAIQGNYNGYAVWDISDPESPDLEVTYVCPASQSDVSFYGDLLFVSGEGLGGRVDCGTQGVPEPVSQDRLRGIRIFDVSDIANPEYVANVQTCRGSHTHTVVTDPNDDENVYIYVSGSSRVRSGEELPGCVGVPFEDDPNTALFRIEVIQVPLADPTDARIVSSPRIFDDLEAPARHAEMLADSLEREARLRARGREPRAGPRTGPTQCHDITVYPEVGWAGGACGGYGLLLDISDVRNPTRVYAAADSNFSFWHSATFNNDGTKVLFTDEWGGGSQPRCRPSDKYEWGANALFTVEGEELVFQSYYKMPAAQTTAENCVAHNGSLIPVPGRDIMVQGWYQGGISVFDWTDPANPFEIAYHDRGPMDETELVMSGSWSVYWYNGYMVSSEIARGLDIFELTASGLLSQNEINAAKTVRLETFNAQEQPRFVWPPSFAMAGAYLDQLHRDGGLALVRINAARVSLAEAEEMSGQERRSALTQLAADIDGMARGASDANKVRTLASSIRELAEER